MQISYKKEEMVDITELSKSLKNFIEKIKNNTLDKIVIMKNNKPEAVLISCEEYEQMKAAANAYISEYNAIADIIDERIPNGEIGETISLEEVVKRGK